MRILFFTLIKETIHKERACVKNKTGRNQNCPNKSIVEVLNLQMIINLSKKSLMDSGGVLLIPH